MSPLRGELSRYGSHIAGAIAGTGSMGAVLTVVP